MIGLEILGGVKKNPKNFCLLALGRVKEKDGLSDFGETRVAACVTRILKRHGRESRSENVPVNGVTSIVRRRFVVFFHTANKSERRFKLGGGDGEATSFRRPSIRVWQRIQILELLEKSFFSVHRVVKRPL